MVAEFSRKSLWSWGGLQLFRYFEFAARSRSVASPRQRHSELLMSRGVGGVGLNRRFELRDRAFQIARIQQLDS